MLSARLFCQVDSIQCQKLVDEMNRILPPDSIMIDNIMIMPRFIGGVDSLISIIENPPYPKAALDNKIEGRVFINFIVDTTGEPRCYEIFSGKTLGFGCEEAALKYIKDLHLKFTPAFYPDYSGEKVPIK